MTQLRLDNVETATVNNNGSRGMAASSMLTFQFYTITLCTADRVVVGITATALSQERFKKIDSLSYILIDLCGGLD